MVYQHSKSMNRIVVGSKKESFNRDIAWKIRTWWWRYVDTTRISLSNRYIVSLSITFYQLFFVFLWIYFGLLLIGWSIFYIICIPFIALKNLLLRITSKTYKV